MMRQRQTRTPNKMDVKYGGPDGEKRMDSRLGIPTLESIVSRRNAIYAAPLMVFVFLFGPFLPYAPKALFFLVSSGFAFDDFVGAGLDDVVNSMVVDPKRIFHDDFPETNLVAKREIFLKEFEHYSATHPLPLISDLDAVEQGPLDTEGVWKTLFLKSGGRNTCAAKYFPETVKAAEESPFKVLSIMFSRLAPGQVIPPHTGYTKLIQLYHLGLKVPKSEPKPYLTAWECEGCPEQKMVWAEGKEFVFDDSFVHAAKNPSEEDRVILFLHLQRIDFKGWRQEMLSGIFHWIFSMLPFAPALSLVEGTEKSCDTLLLGK